MPLLAVAAPGVTSGVGSFLLMPVVLAMGAARRSPDGCWIASGHAPSTSSAMAIMTVGMFLLTPPPACCGCSSPRVC